MPNEVIAAIATPPGRGGIGVVRVSGPGLLSVLGGVTDVDVLPRRATLAAFRSADGSIIDQGLVLFFPAPHSYTGEDVIELQAHGGPVVLQLLLARCMELGARIAEPGEFTRRAFLNDKLDLAQAESVADLIDAASVEAARCALRSLRGEFSQQIDIMVRGLVELRTLVEATLDFPDEEIEAFKHRKLRDKVDEMRARLALTLAASRQGSLLREGAEVVLAGAPNVGKSSLLNSLAGTQRAIVTDIPGTTRDTIRETISIRGVPLHIIDTAGLREPRDPVEKIGISKTWEAIGQADMVLWVSDVTQCAPRAVDAALAARLPAGIPQLNIINKIDLLPTEPHHGTGGNGNEIWLSAKTGSGIELLQSAVLEAIGWRTNAEGVFMARTRHLRALQQAGRHLDAATTCLSEIELFAEELRLAQVALASITGEFTADDLLGEIFSHFCIGK